VDHEFCGAFSTTLERRVDPRFRPARLAAADQLGEGVALDVGLRFTRPFEPRIRARELRPIALVLDVDAGTFAVDVAVD
jgi:hypothetical protein